MAPYPVFDTRARAQIRRQLRLDPISVARLPTTVDAEGGASTGRALVFAGFGTLGETNEAEQLLAAQRRTRIDKVLALELGLDVKAGDFVTAYGVTYEVVEIATTRLRQRAVMRVES